MTRETSTNSDISKYLAMMSDLNMYVIRNKLTFKRLG